jgi:hypothetical protein
VSRNRWPASRAKTLNPKPKSHVLGDVYARSEAMYSDTREMFNDTIEDIEDTQMEVGVSSRNLPGCQQRQNCLQMPV